MYACDFPCYIGVTNALAFRDPLRPVRVNSFYRSAYALICVEARLRVCLEGNINLMLSDSHGAPQ